LERCSRGIGRELFEKDLWRVLSVDTKGKKRKNLKIGLRVSGRGVELLNTRRENLRKNGSPQMHKTRIYVQFINQWWSRCVGASGSAGSKKGAHGRDIKKGIMGKGCTLSNGPILK